MNIFHWYFGSFLQILHLNVARLPMMVQQLVEKHHSRAIMVLPPSIIQGKFAALHCLLGDEGRLFRVSETNKTIE